MLLFHPWDTYKALGDIETQILVSSFSYFVVDTVCGFVGGYNDFWMNLHHVIIFICYADGYFQYSALT